MKRLINETTIESVDKSTGEVIVQTTSKSYSVKTDVDTFYMSFVEFMQPFFELRSTTDKNLIVRLCTEAEYNTGKVYITTEYRDTLCEFLGIDKTALSKSLKRLKDKGLLFGDRGSYVINPIIFWKGDTKTRDTLLKSKDGLSINIQFKS